MNQLLQDLQHRLTHQPATAATPEEMAAVLALGDEAFLDILAVAQQVRTAQMQHQAFTCGIINAKSGRCPENCAFCAQSSHYNTGAPVHSLVSADALLQRAEMLAQAGASRFGIVTSGTRLNRGELETLCTIAQKIVKETGLAVCGSLGLLDNAEAAALKASGFSSYHHNLETARSFFPAICTTHEYDADIATVHAAQAAGLRTCTGGILGMGETWAQRIELSCTLQKLDVDSIPLNFLNPIPGTPLAARSPLAPREALLCIALFRFMHPHRDIIICGGREVTLGEWQSWVFMAGANGLMIGNYLTTSGRDTTADSAMLDTLGVRVATAPGRRTPHTAM